MHMGRTVQTSPATCRLRVLRCSRVTGRSASAAAAPLNRASHRVPTSRRGPRHRCATTSPNPGANGPSTTPAHRANPACSTEGHPRGAVEPHWADPDPDGIRPGPRSRHIASTSPVAKGLGRNVAGRQRTHTPGGIKHSCLPALGKSPRGPVCPIDLRTETAPYPGHSAT